MSFERAWLLIQQGRWELARDELHRVLGSDPENAGAHSMLAICHSEMDQHREALVEAERGVHAAPDVPFAHYAHAFSLAEADRLKEAEVAIGQAIALEPRDPDYKVFAGRMRLDSKDWQGALGFAEEALELDPENVDGTNLRAYALTKLGRNIEAGAAVDAALIHDPNDPHTHANKGWTLLEQGDHAEALKHFREALRLRPNYEWAREGIINALRARHFVYRVMLRYFLWMSRLNARAQWGIIIGGYVAFRVVSAVHDKNPGWGVVLWPLMIAYFGFVYLSWTADALFNLALRLHPFGRLVLDRDEIRASNIVGLLLLGAIGCGLSLFVSPQLSGAVAAIGLATLPIPVSATFAVEGRKRVTLAIYTLCLAAVAAGAVLLVANGSAYAPLFTNGYLLGFFAFSWFANFLFMKR